MPLRRVEKWRYNSTDSNKYVFGDDWTVSHLERFTPGKVSPVSFGYVTGWSAESVWTL
jgi:hypothetical protein